MTPIQRRRKGGYFQVEPGAPAPVVARVRRRIRFSDVDPMGILWYGRYANLFEDANDELGRRCGMSYADFRRERLGAPIVQMFVDEQGVPCLAPPPLQEACRRRWLAGELHGFPDTRLIARARRKWNRNASRTA
jgi:hypothetical protein